MEKQNVDLYDSLCNRSSTHSNQNETQTPNARRLFSIKFNHYFEHSVQCSNCNNRICQNIKRLFHHGRLCKFKNSGKCPIYDKYLESLKMHTECCTSANCSLRFCSNLKSKINHYQLQRAQLLWTTKITAVAKANEHSTSISNDTQQLTNSMLQQKQVMISSPQHYQQNPNEYLLNHYNFH